MKKYVVYVQIPTNDPNMCADDYDVEFSGIKHLKLKCAMDEMKSVTRLGYNGYIQEVSYD